MIKLFFKGAAMGAADLVPGVSGGTVALIVGIYRRLITAISRVDSNLVKLVFSRQWRAAWNYIDASFLAVLASGILCSVFALSHMISFLLTDYPYFIWSFFLGLILASTYLLKQNFSLNLTNAIAMVSGAALCLAVSVSGGLQLQVSLVTLFFGAMVAICAMILPGISGSLLLLLMGLYQVVIDSIKNLDLLVISVFALGALSGLLVFSKLLNWMMAHYYAAVTAFLSGLLIGSIPVVWPWKTNFFITAIDAMALPWSIASLSIMEHTVMLILLLSGILLVSKVANGAEHESN